MVGIALLIGTVIGTLLALVLVLCRKGGLVENKVLHSIVSLYINVVRSVPFIILLVTIMPLTRAILGTTIGSTAALVPLVVYISPYLARLIENSLLEVSPGILEAAQAMGATTWQIIRCFLMPEALVVWFCLDHRNRRPVGRLRYGWLLRRRRYRRSGIDLWL